MAKYRNVKSEYNGIIFDSIKEMRRYQELLVLQKAGEIEFLELQPTYVLLDPMPKIHRGIKYRADFRYYDKKLLKTIVEDVKGMRTDVYKMKKKMMQSKYPFIEIIEI